MTEKQTSRHTERYIIAAIILVAIAAVLWFSPGLQFTGMKLYFPKKDGHTLALERRPIAPIGSLEKKARDVTRELLLGPISRNLQPIVHIDVALERVVAGKNALFLDFTCGDIPNFSPEYSTFKSAVEESLRGTIPGNYRIFLYINGIQAR